MRNASSVATAAPTSSYISLERIWDVDEDESYDVAGTRSPRGCLIAVRTQSGLGELTFRDRDKPTIVDRDSLVVLDPGSLARYRCAGRRWAFWWFEFRTSSAAPCELGKVVHARPHPDDRRAFRESFTALRRADSFERTVASSNFSLMLHRWLTRRRDSSSAGPHAEAVRHVIDLMHERAEGGWSVKEMAVAAHLSERMFRQVFRGATGESPKRFFERLRLEKGQALLQLGIYTVKEVASSLGYSSQFHFSREYKKHFGSPPARVLRSTET